MRTLSSIQTGVAGEYFVCAELTRRGYVASLTLRNTRGIDVLAANADATKSVGIQVKTCQGRRAAWMMNAKAEADGAENLFYVCVCLPTQGEPTYYIVPRPVVAAYVRDTHKAWLATPGRSGKKHMDNPLRSFKDPTGEYKDRWDLRRLDLIEGGTR